MERGNGGWASGASIDCAQVCVNMCGDAATAPGQLTAFGGPEKTMQEKRKGCQS